MEELENLFENLDYENNEYFYHVTGKGFSNQIMEEGLCLEDKNLDSTTIKFPEELIQDPCKYCKEEYRNGIVKRQEMVILGCPKGYDSYLVEESSYPIEIGDNLYNYFVSKEYILGYVDLETLDVTYNPEYIDFDVRRI